MIEKSTGRARAHILVQYKYRLQGQKTNKRISEYFVYDTASLQPQIGVNFHDILYFYQPLKHDTY